MSNKCFKIFSLLLSCFFIVSCDDTTKTTSDGSSVNEEKVAYVESLIENLPNPSTNNEVVKDIFAAQEAYTELTNSEKKQVDNYTTLEQSIEQIYSFVKQNSPYTTKYEVALYIFLYDGLPNNFITKSQANQLGWNGGDVWRYADGKSIGGDRFYNKEQLLPTGTYFECDIDYKGGSRNKKRIVYSLSSDTIYYTSNHYNSFEQLY